MVGSPFAVSLLRASDNNRQIVHYEYIASAKPTPVSREAVIFLSEPQRFGASEPRRVCGHVLKPCSNNSFPAIYS